MNTLEKTDIEKAGVGTSEEAPKRQEQLSNGGIEQQLSFSESVPAEPKGLEGAVLTVESSMLSKEREEGGPNEDALFRNHEKGLYGVFDGAGGRAGAALASKAAAERLATFAATEKDPKSLEGVRSYLKNALQEMHTAVLAARTPGLAEGEGMITTAALTQFFKEGDTIYAVVANVGDSSVFVRKAATGEVFEVSAQQDVLGDVMTALRSQDPEKAKRLSEIIDALLVKPANALDDKTAIADLPGMFEGRTEKGLVEQVLELRRLITSGLGTTELNIATRIVPLQPGDEILITSDGIPDNLSLPEIAASKDLVADASKASKAERAGSKKDDMSAIRIRLEGVESPLTPKQIEEQGIQRVREDIMREAESLERGLPALLDSTELEPGNKAEAIYEMLKRIFKAHAEHRALFVANEVIQRIEAARLRLVAQQKSLDTSRKFAINPATPPAITPEKKSEGEKAKAGAPAKKGIFSRLGGALRGAVGGIRALAARRAAESSAVSAPSKPPRFALSSKPRNFAPPEVKATTETRDEKRVEPAVVAASQSRVETATVPAPSVERPAEVLSVPQEVKEAAADQNEGGEGLRLAEETPEAKITLSPNEIAAMDFNKRFLYVLQDKEVQGYPSEKFFNYLTKELLSPETFGDRTDKQEIATVMNRIMYQALTDADIPLEVREQVAFLLERRGYVELEFTESGDYRVRRLKK